MVRSTELQIQLRIQLFSPVAFKMPTKNKVFFAYYFLKVFYSLQRYKVIKNHKTVEIKVFLIFFCLIIEEFWSIEIRTDPDGPKTYGSGSTKLEERDEPSGTRCLWPAAFCWAGAHQKRTRPSRRTSSSISRPCRAITSSCRWVHNEKEKCLYFALARKKCKNQFLLHWKLQHCHGIFTSSCEDKIPQNEIEKGFLFCIFAKTKRTNFCRWKFQHCPVISRGNTLIKNLSCNSENFNILSNNFRKKSSSQ